VQTHQAVHQISADLQSHAKQIVGKPEQKSTILNVQKSPSTMSNHQWFYKQLACLGLYDWMTSYTSKWQLKDRSYRTLSSDHHVFDHIRKGETSAIQKLLRGREITAYDQNYAGCSLYEVSHRQSVILAICH
jgi:hypothetical protein